MLCPESRFEPNLNSFQVDELPLKVLRALPELTQQLYRIQFADLSDGTPFVQWLWFLADHCCRLRYCFVRCMTRCDSLSAF